MDQCYIVHALLRTSIQCILNLRTRPERMNGELTWMEEDILKLLEDVAAVAASPLQLVLLVLAHFLHQIQHLK